jgi:hypothetical protein
LEKFVLSERLNRLTHDTISLSFFDWMQMVTSLRKLMYAFWNEFFVSLVGDVNICIVPFRCDKQKRPLDEAAAIRQSELLDFYQEITLCKAAPLSVSVFKEYHLMETKFKPATKLYMEEIFQTTKSACISKGNILLIARFPSVCEAEKAHYLRGIAESEEFQVLIFKNMVNYRDW